MPQKKRFPALRQNKAVRVLNHIHLIADLGFFFRRRKRRNILESLFVLYFCVSKKYLDTLCGGAPSDFVRTLCSVELRILHVISISQFAQLGVSFPLRTYSLCCSSVPLRDLHSGTVTQSLGGHAAGGHAAGGHAGITTSWWTSWWWTSWRWMSSW